MTWMWSPAGSTRPLAARIETFGGTPLLRPSCPRVFLSRPFTPLPPLRDGRPFGPFSVGAQREGAGCGCRYVASSVNGSVFLCRIFNISSGKQKKLFKGSQGEDGTLIKVRGPGRVGTGGTGWRGTGTSCVLQLCGPLRRCRQTPRGSTLPPAVLTRTFPFLTSLQASV